MTNRLTIHITDSTLIIDTDNPEKVQTVSEFCKDRLNAVNCSESYNELKAQSVTSEAVEELYKLLFQLGIF